MSASSASARRMLSSTLEATAPPSAAPILLWLAWAGRCRLRLAAATGGGWGTKFWCGEGGFSWGGGGLGALGMCEGSWGYPSDGATTLVPSLVLVCESSLQNFEEAIT